MIGGAIGDGLVQPSLRSRRGRLEIEVVGAVADTHAIGDALLFHEILHAARRRALFTVRHASNPNCCCVVVGKICGIDTSRLISPPIVRKRKKWLSRTNVSRCHCPFLCIEIHETNTGSVSKKLKPGESNSLVSQICARHIEIVDKILISEYINSAGSLESPKTCHALSLEVREIDVNLDERIALNVDFQNHGKSIFDK